MRFRKLILFPCGSLFLGMFMVIAPFALFAQYDTLRYLREVEITAQRIDLTDIGKHTDKMDSQTISSVQYDNLATMLSMQTPLYIRSYGNGSLSTLGIRGGSAAHTQLLWNGIPLRNPMVGLVDLALIPSVFVDETAVHYGGHGAAFGSGAIGGLISLANETLQQRNDISFHLCAGSWDKRNGEIKLNYGLKRLRFSTRLFSQYAENNYRYKLNKDFPERNQVHDQLSNAGLLQEISLNVNEHEQVTARLWYQKADRQIPPTSTQTNSQTAQQDKNLRMSVQWMRKGERRSWQIKTAWLDESINYQDSLILLYTHNQFRTWLVEGESSFYLGPDMSFTGGLYTEIVSANSGNYLAATSRHQHAGFMTWRYIKKAWLWRAQLREENTDKEWSPLLMDFSMEWSGIKHVTARTSLSRNYRTPTLNDLYWRPGGNPDLQPEKGWTYEAGLDFTHSDERFDFQSSFTAYTRTIDQWIMWMPPTKDISNYWSPINIAQVHSHGIEVRGDLRWKLNQLRINLNTGLDLTWSTFGNALHDFMIHEGDQLFYVPVENALAGIRLEFKSLEAYYHHHWFGDSPGINEDVAAGNIGAAGLALHFKQPKLDGSLYLQADNIWNVPYRIIERRPMAGRSLTVGLRFTFF